MEKFLYNRNNSGYINLLMGFPAPKSFALSSLGYMWLYKLSDTTDGINSRMVCKDTYADIDINKINAISFSMSFDFDFMGVFEILDKYKIPLPSKERGDSFPLIFAGGPVITTNPEPYKQIFDFMVIGDGESVFPKILEILKMDVDKTQTLEHLSKLEGIYIPYKTKTVKKLTERLNNIIYTPVISDESYFKNTFIIEIARGCMNRCAFCTASYINLPFRSYGYDKIIEAIGTGLQHTNKIALLGAQISAHPDFNKVMEYLRNKIEAGNNIELSLSSLRVDGITPGLVQTLVLGGQKTTTIAIEAASERLRKFINKNISEKQIFEAVKIIKENGLKGVKIYAMIGLPNETDEDIHEFILLAERLKKENPKFELTFSFSSFVPKPHTPFQYCPREDTNTLEKKQKYLQKSLAKLGIESKFSSIKWDYIQTLLSRSGEEITPLLIDVYKNGGKLGAYKQALKKFKINTEPAISGYKTNETLPWEFIEFGTSKDMINSEFRRLNKFTDCKEL